MLKLLFVSDKELQSRLFVTNGIDFDSGANKLTTTFYAQKIFQLP